MAKCAVTGKKTVFGRSIQHKHGGGWAYRAPKTNRTFKPNVHKHRIFVPETGEWLHISISAKALRTISKKGLVATLRDHGRTLDDVR